MDLNFEKMNGHRLFAVRHHRCEPRHHCVCCAPDWHEYDEFDVLLSLIHIYEIIAVCEERAQKALIRLMNSTHADEK